MIAPREEIVLNCIVVDDESMAVEGLVAHIEKVDFLKLTHRCSSAMDAADVLRNNEVDLMFLDINMPHLSGLDFLETLKNPPLTILSTAYSEYAVDGFRLNAVDYLLKPFSFKRFFQAAEKALDQFKQRVEPDTSEDTDSLFIRIDDSYKRILWRDIIYVEAMQNYLKLHFQDETFVIHQTMTFIEGTLPKKYFFRIHKSYLINIAYIDSVFGEKVLVGGKALPLSKYRKKDLFDEIVLHNLISK